jgi:uronate dehydrogenase
MISALTVPDPGYAVVWGISRNTRRWWIGDDAERIGYFPQDDAEAYADRVNAETGAAVSLAFQGASHCAIGYTRDESGERS